MTLVPTPYLISIPSQFKEIYTMPGSSKKRLNTLMIIPVLIIGSVMTLFSLGLFDDEKDSFGYLVERAASNEKLNCENVLSQEYMVSMESKKFFVDITSRLIPKMSIARPG